MAQHKRNPDELFIHKSGLTAYRTCPLKFCYMYVHPIKPDRTEEMVFGQEFHDAAHNWYHLLNEKVFFAHKSWTDRFEYSLSLVDDSWTPRVQRLMRSFCKMECNRAVGWSMPKAWFKPILQEKYYEIYDPNKYAGTIDRVDHYDDLYLIVGDYKSGKMYNISTARQEMAVYAVILNNVGEPLLEETGKYVAYWCTIHPSTEETYVEEFKGPTLRALAKNTAKIWYDVEQDEFKPKVGEHCDYCQFLYKCAAEPWYWEMVR